MFPEACSWSARGQARGKGRGGRERPPNHTGLAWEDSLLSGRVGAVNPVSPAGESGWGGRAFLRGSRSVDKEAERIPESQAVGGPRGPGNAWEELPSCT